MVAYCKYCGMESKDPKKCEWCGKEIEEVRPGPPLPDVKTAQQLALEADVKAHQNLVAFFVSVGILIVLASIVIFVRWGLFPVAILVSMLIAGVLLGQFRIIPRFEDEWSEFIVPVILLIFFPALFVYVGYITWGLLTKEMDTTLVWILSVYFGMLTILLIITMIAGMATGPGKVGGGVLLMIQGTQFLSLVALVIGWAVSKAFSGLET